jgi:hypothetical protein
VPSKNRKGDVVPNQKTGSRSSNQSEHRKQELAQIRKQEAGYSRTKVENRKRGTRTKVENRKQSTRTKVENRKQGTRTKVENR